MELTLRLRDPVVPLLVGLILTACALLVPGPTAGYAVVVIDGHRPVMSADASLAAAGVVLATFLLPLFALFLDVGHTRDAQLGVDELHLTSPARAEFVAAGRLCANALFALAVAALALVVTVSTVYARSLGVASPSAAAVFLLIVAPVALAAVLLGAMLDRYLGGRSGARTVVALGIWLVAMSVSVVSARDLLGVTYLRKAAAPGDRAAAMSVGIITDRGLPTIPWTSAPLTSDLVRDRLALAALLALGALVLVPMLRRGLTARSAPGVAGWAEVPAVTQLRLPPAPHPLVPAVGLVRLFSIVVMRWMARSHAVVALTLLTLVLAVHGGATTGAALASALVIVPVVLSKTSSRELRVAATLESTTAALLRPSRMLTSCWMLALLALGAASPALLRLSAIQAATAILGMLATTMWLTWTHQCVARPVLGVSIFALIWYATVFNHPPPVLDLFGLWQADLGALGIAATAAGITFALVWRHARLGHLSQGAAW